LVTCGAHAQEEQAGCAGSRSQGHPEKSHRQSRGKAPAGGPEGAEPDREARALPMDHPCEAGTGGASCVCCVPWVCVWVCARLGQEVRAVFVVCAVGVRVGVCMAGTGGASCMCVVCAVGVRVGVCTAGTKGASSMCALGVRVGVCTAGTGGAGCVCYVCHSVRVGVCRGVRVGVGVCTAGTGGAGCLCVLCRGFACGCVHRCGCGCSCGLLVWCCAVMYVYA